MSEPPGPVQHSGAAASNDAAPDAVQDTTEGYSTCIPFDVAGGLERGEQEGETAIHGTTAEGTS